MLILLVLWRCTEPKDKTDYPEVASASLPINFIDIQRCAPCHKEIVTSYQTTGKGRSFFPASAKNLLEDWNVKPVYDATSMLYYLPYRTDSLFFIKEFRLEGKDTVHSRTEQIHYFIGSGNQTRTYLFQRNGYLFEHPITWYARKKLWDLSPGYENGSNHRFDRKVGPECLACHNTGFQAVAHSENRYTTFGAVIGCESCHGNVEAHLKAKQSTRSVKQGAALVNLKTIPPIAKLDLCRQCHLEGVKVRKANSKPGDYEPGKLLSDYYEVFIPATGEADFGFASHAERLQLSQCYLKSAGKLTCTSCHDPHSAIPEKKTEFFSLKCTSCHSEGSHQKSCSGVKTMEITPAAASDCIQCHMQTGGTSDIPHVNSTDHLIRRILTRARKSTDSALTFRNFASQHFTPKDLAQAKLQYAEVHPESQPQLFPELIVYLNRMDQSAETNPDFTVKLAYLAKQKLPVSFDTGRLNSTRNPYSLYYWSQLKKLEAKPYLSALEKAGSLAPDWVELRYRLALEKEELGLDARPDYHAVLQLDSMHCKALTNLGFHSMNSGNWKQAEIWLRRAVRCDPDYLLAQENLVRCLMSEGKFDQAKKLLNRMIRRNPKEDRYQKIRQTIP